MHISVRGRKIIIVQMSQHSNVGKISDSINENMFILILGIYRGMLVMFLTLIPLLVQIYLPVCWEGTRLILSLKRGEKNPWQIENNLQQTETMYLGYAKYKCTPFFL